LGNDKGCNNNDVFDDNVGGVDVHIVPPGLGELCRKYLGSSVYDVLMKDFLLSL
jgi:hypothetical protein